MAPGVQHLSVRHIMDIRAAVVLAAAADMLHIKEQLLFQ
jgi:hypothetical protein